MTAAAVLPRSNQHEAGGLRVDAADLQLRLRDGRLAACPAELPSWPSEPCPRVRS
jgi:hypothetical protein